MNTASRKCRNYHCCHDDHSPRGSHAHRHRVRYHDGSTLHPGDRRDKLSCSPPPRVVLNASPGNYVVTAARWGPQATPTTRVVNLDPEKYVTLTMTV
ncbi:hypothetical protein GBAR_LOCUS22821 [Geodia barretti]|uniref:Uncharacterized protein n=1 Tax=Geodia barretti TaxID=519541 RepID=A0AA35T587_GEOBA|nr:hypothetical protein GBAR_LOCUS22821 [Geodia barretti]